MRKAILCTLILCYSIISYCQVASLSGTVIDNYGKAVAFAIIHEKNTNNATTTDENGNYLLNIEFGQKTIVFSNVGFVKHELKVNIDRNIVNLPNVILEPNPETSLTEATIIAKSNVRMVEETGFNVVAIDAKPFHNAAINLTEVLDQTPGVKINQEGGLGSKSNVTINGLSGRHVRFFIDGMPMDAMSSAFQLNNLPVNMSERIEVYKGVVPINFGSDALGGAVNIVTKKNPGTYLDASYSYGSFNTHMTFVNAGHTSDKGFTIQLSAYQNYSDNNYFVDGVKVLDFETNLYTNPQRVQRFHDTYHNETAILKLGLVNKRFADQFLFGFTYGQEYQEVQHPAYINIVYGDKHYTSSTIMPSILYSKDDIFIENLNINLAANYNFGEGHNVDTTYWQYNWLGERRLSNSKGEVTPASDYRYNDNNGTINANIDYEFLQGHRFTINNVSNFFSREGYNILDIDDKMNQYPRVNNRNILGIGLNNDFSEKLKTSIFTKRYSYYSSAYINQVVGGVEDYMMVSKDDSRWGFGFTTTYFIADILQLKANFENTFRMPTSQELFGQVFLEPQQNLSLLPETSNNFNFGIHFNKQIKQKNFISTDLNFFYRHTEDFIKRTVDMKKGGESYENISLVKTPGVDAEIRCSNGDRFTCGANLSYQKPMNYDTENFNTYYKAVVPNQPNFFGNADAGYFFNDLWMMDSRLSIRYTLQFIHEFANDWGTYASAEKIPTQWSHNVGVVYSWKQGRYNLSIDCKNLTDAKLYDNFSLQKPGRSFSAKFRYYINSKS
ncbi:TonB-dependent receptor plug domain-containing protein [Carboxylicivirga caseinilyticus]|uniref:TonB-dependent receptor n=1 Tax=Carboxylicivirga caseinilyticus TaxID=3417572 RepID=UPI003D342F01|nr:TonB-dependent receptor [Marinilabiliaceae bacterium A049]